jgi:hypothetical protein
MNNTIYLFGFIRNLSLNIFSFNGIAVLKGPNAFIDRFIELELSCIFCSIREDPFSLQKLVFMPFSLKLKHLMEITLLSFEF